MLTRVSPQRCRKLPKCLDLFQSTKASGISAMPKCNTNFVIKLITKLINTMPSIFKKIFYESFSTTP